MVIEHAPLLRETYERWAVNNAIGENMIHVRSIGTDGETPVEGRSPTLAERAREIINDQNTKMIEHARDTITKGVLKHATKQNLIYDMKHDIGSCLGIECTRYAFQRVSEWLEEEGLKFDTEEKRNAAKITNSLASNYNQTYRNHEEREVFGFNIPERKTDRRVSEFTFYISW
ncbi:hypothetical protein POFPNCPI_00017 [Klebsiella phage vB_KpM-Mild]|nr:hypothetical protein ayl_00170 [Klebsiella phage AYL]WMX17994.1 hypothetical protein [Klebsiella phage KpF2]CAD5241033.1 hypothetical protein POFPNCPI_00017 [Klebsiella phage vB_KpM-Mild]CAD5241413.1 hypothetical protein EHPPICDA_00052 [Klebsiella phage vB_KpM-SoFaint]CAD5242590.1 hypothetical protein GCLPFEGH_00199 [Klebsiella phage vB_KpM-KalD]